MPASRVAFPRWALVLAVVWVLVLHPVLDALDAPVWVLGPLDWSAHLATAVLVLANLPVRLRTPFVVAALIASVAIDVDHLPQYLGTDVLTQGTVRPYTHSLATVAAALLAAAALRGRARRIAFGIAAGVTLHLVRDVATGAGVPLVWPLSKDAVHIPFWIEAAVLAALAARAWSLTRRLPQVRSRPPRG